MHRPAFSPPCTACATGPAPYVAFYYRLYPLFLFICVLKSAKRSNNFTVFIWKTAPARSLSGYPVLAAGNHHLSVRDAVEDKYCRRRSSSESVVEQEYGVLPSS